MANDMTWKEAIAKVLKESPGALHYTEITERILAEDLVQTKGKTPSATVSSTITVRMSDDLYQVSKGTYIWKDKLQKPEGILDVSSEDIDDEMKESQYDIITCFGMYWRRSAVDWRGRPNICGAQAGADRVDFSDQVGLYLLHDVREIIYVGQTRDQTLSKRLAQHTRGRLSSRWDRFSWFGMLPVSAESGDWARKPSDVDSAKLLDVLESVLIEAVEPRQNRRQGEGLAGVEYNQYEDPSIMKSKLIESIKNI